MTTMRRRRRGGRGRVRARARVAARRAVRIVTGGNRKVASASRPRGLRRRLETRARRHRFANANGFFRLRFSARRRKRRRKRRVARVIRRASRRREARLFKNAFLRLFFDTALRVHRARRYVARGSRGRREGRPPGTEDRSERRRLRFASRRRRRRRRRASRARRLGPFGFLFFAPGFPARVPQLEHERDARAVAHASLQREVQFSGPERLEPREREHRRAEARHLFAAFSRGRSLVPHADPRHLLVHVLARQDQLRALHPVRVGGHGARGAHEARVAHLHRGDQAGDAERAGLRLRRGSRRKREGMTEGMTEGQSRTRRLAWTRRAERRARRRTLMFDPDLRSITRLGGDAPDAGGDAIAPTSRLARLPMKPHLSVRPMTKIEIETAR